MQQTEFLNAEKLQALVPTQLGYGTCDVQEEMTVLPQDGVVLVGITDGHAVMQKRGKAYAVQPGNVCVVLPFEEMTVRTEDEVSFVKVGFNAIGELPDWLMQQAVVRSDADAVWDDLRHAADMECGKTAFVTAKLWEWLAQMQQSSTAVTVTAKTDAVDRALDTIHAQYAQNLTVSDLAAQVSLDRSYFYTVFHKRTGQSPQEYLVGYRLDKAAEWMREQGVSPSAAASAVGYTDLCQFSKMFKRRFGVSPRAYKKGGVSPAPSAAPTARIWADEPDVVLL